MRTAPTPAEQARSRRHSPRYALTGNSNPRRLSGVTSILGLVTNPTGNWALENLPAFEELYAAIEQMSLEAGAAGDSVTETGNLEAAAPSIDGARERVARAAAIVREGPVPPDAASAQHLTAMLDALDEFRTAELFDEWVQAWVRAMERRDAFTEAFAIANGQRPATS
jgi:hypothetical protein